MTHAPQAHSAESRTTATERLFRAHYGRLFRLAVALLHDEEEARDVVGEVFARMLDGRDSCCTLPYLLVSTRNRCLDLICHKRVGDRLRRLLTAETAPDLSPTDIIDARYNELLRQVDTLLSPKTRKVFRLRCDEQCSYKAIAARLNISEAAVYKHLRQAVTQLKAHFNPDRYER